MIPIPSGSLVWIATGHTDMRRGIIATMTEVSTTSTAGSAMFVLCVSDHVQSHAWI